MNRSADAAVAEMAARQYGIFTLEHATRSGVSRDQRSRRLRSGRWEQLHPGVYRLAGAPVIWEGRVLAACWADGPRGRASHRSAAALRGLPGGTRTIVEITCERWHRARLDDLVVHESKRFEAADTLMHRGVPIASVDVTLLQLGAVVSELVVEQALDAAINRSLTSMTSARQTLERMARRGRNGCGTLRAILDRRAPVVATAESPAETALLRMLLRQGLPVPVLQHEVRDGGVLVARVDAAYPEFRIALEYESYEHHTGRAALVRDSARRNRLARLGWTVVSVTAEDLRTGGLTVVTTIRDLMRTPNRFGVVRTS